MDSNAISPIAVPGETPLLAMDVWEHSCTLL